MSRGPVEVRVPGDKSITHRALILASLAEGPSRLEHPLDSADTRATMNALRALGTEIGGLRGGETVVHGRGIHGWRVPREAIDCGNSGTTARLLLGALAGCPFESRLTGDASLRARPMRRVTEPLTAAGAAFEELGESDRLPIRVRGRRPLAAVEHDGPRASAQVKSALLLAGLLGGADVRVTEPGRSRDHTERMLAAMGAPVRVADMEPAGSPAGRPGEGEGRARTEVRLSATRSLEPLDLAVPRDPSSAAFFLGLAAPRGSVRVVGVGLNPTRTRFLDVLARMGANVTVEPGGEAAGEPVGAVVVDGSGLAGTVVEPDEVPALLDEIPLLAALAAAAEGETRFEGVAELRVKETDRIAALVENLRALSVDAEDGPDWLVVRGTADRMRGTVRSFDDHRIAMAFGVLGAFPGNDIAIEGRDAVEVSFPGFWQELERVRTELVGT